MMAKRVSFQTAALALFALTVVDAIELVNLNCDPTLREESKCGAGGLFNGDGALSGTFVCGRRSFGLPGFTWQQPSTVCVATVLGQVIGYEDDTCGCCNNECPKLCTCVCDEEKDFVLVKKRGFFGGESTECMNRGKASRRVSDGTTDYSCVPDEECETYETPSDTEVPPADSQQPPADTEVPPADTGTTEAPPVDSMEPPATEVPPADTEGTEVPPADTEATEQPPAETEGTEEPPAGTEGTTEEPPVEFPDGDIVVEDLPLEEETVEEEASSPQREDPGE